LSGLLVRKCGSSTAAASCIEEVCLRLGIPSEEEKSVLAAVTLVTLGVSPEIVSRALSWRDFESFCADVALARGYDVRQNVTLRKPRAQVDVIARSGSIILTMDCKHWSRLGPSALRKIALAQLRRSRILRQTLQAGQRPIASSILTLFDNQERFVEGVAIVPVITLPSFLQSLDSLTGMLEFA
jgi:hypothetical protein